MTYDVRNPGPILVWAHKCGWSSKHILQDCQVKVIGI